MRSRISRTVGSIAFASSILKTFIRAGDSKSRIQESGVRIQNDKAETRFCFYSGFWILASDSCSSMLVRHSDEFGGRLELFDLVVKLWFDCDPRRRRLKFITMPIVVWLVMIVVHVSGSAGHVVHVALRVVRAV